LKILFDHGTPAPLRHELLGHLVETAHERGWSALLNGDLIAAAESAGFEVLVTTDKNLRYQQNLAGRRLAIVVLFTTSWPRLKPAVPLIVRAIAAVGPGSFLDVPSHAAP
jgi:predicted nuclease of predicted toxin-antitoxin system